MTLCVYNINIIYISFPSTYSLVSFYIFVFMIIGFSIVLSLVLSHLLSYRLSGFTEHILPRSYPSHIFSLSLP